MATSTRTPTATDRLRELLDLIAAVGARDAARQVAQERGHDPDVVLAEGGAYPYLFGLLQSTARYALAEWEDQLDARQEVPYSQRCAAPGCERRATTIDDVTYRCEGCAQEVPA